MHFLEVLTKKVTMRGGKKVIRRRVTKPRNPFLNWHFAVRIFRKKAKNVQCKRDFFAKMGKAALGFLGFF